LKNYVNVPSKSNKQKNFLTIFLLVFSRSLTKRAGSGSGPGPKCHESGTLFEMMETAKKSKTEKIVVHGITLRWDLPQ
jgi:hypothetical protein